MNPFRSPPPAPARAPRASWWRRLLHRDVVDRLEVRRLRLAALAEAPWAGWRERNDLAVATLDAVRRHGVEADAAAVLASMLRSEIALRAPRWIAISGPAAVRRWADAAAKDVARDSWACT